MISDFSKTKQNVFGDLDKIMLQVATHIPGNYSKTRLEGTPQYTRESGPT